ncbi:MAG: hypothetical protein H0W41_00150 [Chloroflexi bacterium]|nr:hypothetical protein [Chloroflexota bacterium]
MLKAQDLICALAIRLVPHAWSYSSLSAFTGLSTSQSHIACRRLVDAKLLRQDEGAAWQVPAANLAEFLAHGVPYVFPARLGEATRGIPTAYSAPFVASAFVASNDAAPLVWPTMDGEVKGNSLEPLHPCQLRCIAKPGGEPIYRALVCVDLLRVGQARERAWATDTLNALLQHAER